MSKGLFPGAKSNASFVNYKKIDVIDELNFARRTHARVIRLTITGFINPVDELIQVLN